MATPLPLGQNRVPEYPDACVNAKQLRALGFSLFAVKRRDKAPAVRSWKRYTVTGFRQAQKSQNGFQTPARESGMISMSGS
jgi:hypothetical protein